MRVGIIGTGYFSIFHAKILSGLAGVKITAIYGTSLEKRSQWHQSLRMREGITIWKGCWTPFTWIQSIFVSRQWRMER